MLLLCVRFRTALRLPGPHTTWRPPHEPVRLWGSGPAAGRRRTMLLPALLLFVLPRLQPRAHARRVAARVAAIVTILLHWLSSSSAVPSAVQCTHGKLPVAKGSVTHTLPAARRIPVGIAGNATCSRMRCRLPAAARVRVRGPARVTEELLLLISLPLLRAPLLQRRVTHTLALALALARSGQGLPARRRQQVAAVQLWRAATLVLVRGGGAVA